MKKMLVESDNHGHHLSQSWAHDHHKAHNMVHQGLLQLLYGDALGIVLIVSFFVHKGRNSRHQAVS